MVNGLGLLRMVRCGCPVCWPSKDRAAGGNRGSPHNHPWRRVVVRFEPALTAEGTAASEPPGRYRDQGQAAVTQAQHDQEPHRDFARSRVTYPTAEVLRFVSDSSTVSAELARQTVRAQLK